MFHCLDFHHDPVVNDQVHAVTAVEPSPLVNYRKPDLTSKGDSGLGQVETEACLISRFKQTGPKLPMNFNSNANNTSAEPHAGIKPTTP